MSAVDNFTPAWWLPGPHAPTIWCGVVTRGGPNELRHQQLALPDGDHTYLTHTAQETKERSPTVLILHGLEGSAESIYVRALLRRVVEFGWHGTVLNFRGCLGGPNRLDRSYHSGDTADLAFCLDYLRSQRPAAPVFAVGYSLGGNVLLKYLGETAADAMVDAAVAVSVPFDLGAAATQLDSGFSRFYQWRLLRSMKAKFRTKFSDRAWPVAREEFETASNFWRYDDVVTAPLHGFGDVHDYYRRSSCHGYLRAIERETLIIHAIDDPFVPSHSIPDRTQISATTSLDITTRGGHVAFPSGRIPLRSWSWLDRRIANWLRDKA